MNGKYQGFTFVELMVVLAIVALLLTIALPRYFEGLERAKEAVLKEDLVIFRRAIDDYVVDKGSYPSTLEVLVSQRYLRDIPVDPITESANSWILIGVPEKPNLIFDIRSGAEGQASDGSFYYDW